MPGFQSLNVAISGLRAAQTGLAVTAHNMANAEINGFSRQRSIQSTSFSRSMGTSLSGHPLKVGMGTDNQPIMHIRNKYFDMLYRQYNARLHFYSIKSVVGAHIEDILGETENTYKLSNKLMDLWASLQELSMSPESIETRELLIGNAISFIDKATNIFDELFELQLNLDSQIRAMVTEINTITARIDVLNEEIRVSEFSGDNANDMRDERHRLMDRLSGLLPVIFFEHPDTGVVDITTIGGNFLLSQGARNPLGLLQISGRYSFVEPVFTHAQGVLPSNTPPGNYVPLFNWRVPIDAATGNDQGALMALLQARGAMPATYRGIDALWPPAHPLTRPPVADTTVPPVHWSSFFDFGSPLPITLADLPTQWDTYFTNVMNFINGVNADPTVSNYTGPVPPDRSRFPTIQYDPPLNWPAEWAGNWPASADWRDSDGEPITDPIPWYENPIFIGEFITYLMERQNDVNQFQTLYPLSLTNGAAFRDALGVDATALAAARQDARDAQLVLQGLIDAGAGPGDPAYDAARAALTGYQAALAVLTSQSTQNRDIIGNYNAASRTFNQAAWSKQHALIPRMQMQMDKVVNAVVRLFNESVAPVSADMGKYDGAPFDLYRNRSFTEVFVRRIQGQTAMDRFQGFEGFDFIHNPGMPGMIDQMYTSRNLMVNPLLIRPPTLGGEPSGYNLLALSPSGDLKDTRLLEEMVRQWNLSDGDFSIRIGEQNFSINDAYNFFIVGFAIEIAEANTALGSQFQQVAQADFRRNATAGVSLDEELSSMMTFQFAYQAAARLFNVIDSMIDTVVNRMGRVGL